VREGDEDRLHAEAVRRLTDTAVEDEARRGALGPLDLDVPPEAGRGATGERLEERLLGREARGEVPGRVALPLAIGDLARSEELLQELRPLLLRLPRHPGHVEEVGADSEDHGRRPQKKDFGRERNALIKAASRLIPTLGRHRGGFNEAKGPEGVPGVG